jgi:hypothetical protein
MIFYSKVAYKENLKEVLKLMYERSGQFPDSVNDGLYYFSKPHSFDIFIKNQKISIPVVHSVMYNNENMFFAVNSKKKKDSLKSFDLVKNENNYKIDSFEFNKENFLTIRLNLISHLLPYLTAFFKKNGKFSYIFRCNFKNQKTLLLIHENSFDVFEFSDFDGEFATNSTIENRKILFSYNISENEKEYIVHYDEPHEFGSCKNNIKKEREWLLKETEFGRVLQPQNWKIKPNSFSHFFLIYRIKNNIVSKMHLVLLDCSQEEN